MLLPHSYFVNDHRQLYPRPFSQTPTRREHGLPEKGVIFGNFGQLYKVEPKLFDVWAEIVKRTPNASMWLLKFPKEAVPRLEQQARARGLTADQMVLSSLLPIDAHLAIKALADIALDTAMFNGHTTGADTLWTGTPLVSLSGEQMRSRAGASMAYSLGVTDFLARSLEDYQALALRLSRSPRRLRRARGRLERALDSSPFFDTALWAKGFERSWFLMWDAFLASPSLDSQHLITSDHALTLDPADLVPPLSCLTSLLPHLLSCFSLSSASCAATCRLPQMRSARRARVLVLRLYSVLCLYSVGPCVLVWASNVCCAGQRLGRAAVGALAVLTVEWTVTGRAGGQGPDDRDKSPQARRLRTRTRPRSSRPVLRGW